MKKNDLGHVHPVRGLPIVSVRFLGGPVDDPASFLKFVTARWGAVADTMTTHRTQTNEPGRCATLLPLLASLPQPLALVEVGASAGLCLYPDRYSYRYTTSRGEHRLGDSEIALSCAVTGPVPMPARLPEVVWRAGLDLNPLQANRDDDRRWLAPLVWPEQIDRAERLDRALDLSPPTRPDSTPVTCSSTCRVARLRALGCDVGCLPRRKVERPIGRHHRKSAMAHNDCRGR